MRLVGKTLPAPKFNQNRAWLDASCNLIGVVLQDFDLRIGQIVLKVIRMGFGWLVLVTHLLEVGNLLEQLQPSLGVEQHRG
jgi:hypothetical protein